jgi:SAM-dependent methyltransferase
MPAMPPLTDDEAYAAVFEGSDLLAPGGPDETRALAREMGLERGQRVLEIGSGTGRTACQLAREFGVRVTGIELSPRFIAAARARAEREGVADRVEFIEMDMRSLDPSFDAAGAGVAPRAPGRPPERAFDAVLSEGALSIMGIEAGCRAARAFLRPGGGVLGFTGAAWLVPEERVPPAVRDLFGGSASGIEPTMHRLADAGFSRGFVFPLPVEAWDRYHAPIRESLRRLRAAGATSPVLDKLEREIHVFDALSGRETAGYVAFVAFPD